MDQAAQLLMLHAIGDYGLQSKYAIDRKMEGDKLYLLNHCLIHGGLVYLVTGSSVLSVGIFISHLVIDYLKTRHFYNEMFDQLLHFLVICGFCILGIK